MYCSKRHPYVLVARLERSTEVSLPLPFHHLGRTIKFRRYSQPAIQGVPDRQATSLDNLCSFYLHLKMAKQKHYTSLKFASQE
jgi:hypothetical protein